MWDCCGFFRPKVSDDAKEILEKVSDDGDDIFEKDSDDCDNLFEKVSDDTKDILEKVSDDSDDKFEKVSNDAKDILKKVSDDALGNLWWWWRYNWKMFLMMPKKYLRKIQTFDPMIKFFIKLLLFQESRVFQECFYSVLIMFPKCFVSVLWMFQVVC